MVHRQLASVHPAGTRCSAKFLHTCADLHYLNTACLLQSKRWKTFRVRTVSTLVLIGSFIGFIWAGHVPLMFMIFGIQVSSSETKAHSQTCGRCLSKATYFARMHSRAHTYKQAARSTAPRLAYVLRQCSRPSTGAGA